MNKFSDLSILNTGVIDETKQFLLKQKTKKPGISVIKQICTMLSATKSITNNARKLDYCLTIVHLALQSLNSGAKWHNSKFEPERCACNILSKLIDLGSVYRLTVFARIFNPAIFETRLGR